MKLSLYTRIWNKIHIFCITGLSIGLYLAFMFSYDLYSPTSSRGSVLQIISTPYFYVVLVVILVVSFVFDGGFHIIRRVYKPTSSEILMDYSVDYNYKASQHRKRTSKLKEPRLIIND